VHAIYDEPFWRDAGLSGQLTSDRGPVKVVFDNSPPDGRPGVLLGFLEGNQARELVVGLPRSADNASSTVSLDSSDPRPLRPGTTSEKIWADDEWTRGCYGAFFPRILDGLCDALRAPIGPIHWAGAETATRWMATWTEQSARVNERFRVLHDLAR